MTRQRVLVLDGQTNQALAVTRSLGRQGHSIFVASHRRSPLASWSRHCRETLRLSAESPDAIRAAIEWARARGIEIVLPLTERSCVLVNLSRKSWEQAGIVVGCAEPDVLEGSFDKARTVAIAQSVGVRVPETCVPATLEEAERAAASLGHPAVVKPRVSHAWIDNRFLPDVGCAYVGDSAAARRAITERKQGETWPLIQRSVPGKGKGVFAMCDHGRAIAWFAHERLRDVRPSGSGSSLRRAIPLDRRLKEPAERLLEALRWHGPAMVEFRDDEVGAPCLMEVNGRFWTSLQLAVDAGVDFPALWIDVLRGEVRPAASDYTSGLTLRWIWGDVKRLAYIAAGRPSGYDGPFPTLWQGLKEICGPQPVGTRLETWRRDDPWPALGEWVQGVGDMVKVRSKKSEVRSQKSEVRSSAPGTEHPAPAFAEAPAGKSGTQN